MNNSQEIILAQISAIYDKPPFVNDMYPQYWTSGIGGIFMRYSYEYKKMCVELYRQGKWVETPEGVKEKNFRNMIQIWVILFLV